ncbi:hypothetical protein A3F66_04390 [candidate division TM6 bacterium RIFCSPHIGHO2_12_FULL_32_22]|nr:MAG: hypothetical protein A3F66_04390 [candidate division TM6 bacterium RIFCSPHIGHO2_12_FULL_32_22]
MKSQNKFNEKLQFLKASQLIDKFLKNNNSKYDSCLNNPEALGGQATSALIDFVENLNCNLK